MAQVRVNIENIVKYFIVEALKDNIHITKAILFGSFAKGTNTEYRDIDIAVVSDDFDGNSF